MGDIGRSSASLPIPPNTFYVYRIPESNLGAGQTSGTLSAEQFPFVYPDGGQGAESLMVHPVTADLYVITKNVTNGPSKVYRFPRPLPAPGVVSTLVFVSDLPLTTSGDTNLSRAATGSSCPPTAPCMSSARRRTRPSPPGPSP